MRTFIISMLLMLFFLLNQTLQASAAQERCVQHIVNQCITKCQHGHYSNCTETCQENSQNECRQAGE